MTETQKRVWEIWKETFTEIDVGLDDNFFEIGGDSIKAMNIISKIRAELFELDVNYFFEYQTIREIADKIDEELNRR